MSVTDDGIIIFVSDEQLSKVRLLIIFQNDGIVICVSDLHLLKVPISIEAAYDGMVICSSDEHPSKAFSPIKITMMNNK